MLTLGSLAVGALGLVLGALKLWLIWRRKSAAAIVAETDHAMLQDAVDRSSDDDVSRSLHDGSF